MTVRRPARDRRAGSTVQRGAAAAPVSAAPFDPFTALSWTAGYWAGDPAWTPPADGAQVTSWRDGSGNSRTVTSASGIGTGALFRQSVAELNAKPAVDFDGASALAFTTTPALSQPHCTVAVIVFDSLTGSQRFHGGATAANTRGIGKAAGGQWAMDYTTADTGTGGDPAASTAYLVRARASGATTVFEVNGSTIPGIDSVGTSGQNQIVLGAGRTSAPVFANYFNGKIAFLGIAPDATVDAVWSAFKASAAAHYGISVA